MAKRTKIPLYLLCAATLILATTVLLQLGGALHRESDQDYLSLLRQVRGIIKNSFVEKVSDKQLTESAVNGMLAALDPHSAYLPPEPFKEMNIQLAGSFGGVGIEISIKEGKLTVISPIEDTPAYRAGIKAGDHIWKIDGKPTAGLSITDAVNRMRGEKGTKVVLAILREGSKAPLVFPLVRDIIKTHSLKSATLEPGFGYIKIGHFQQLTADEFGQALKRLHAENRGTLQGLIIDLRNNPGGALDPAIKVAGYFIGVGFSDGLIVSTRGRIPSASREFSASIGEKEPAYPVVVLINGGSASASEIVAGALQDHGRAVIMGTQSFGKGSVQSIIPLRNGAGLKLTTALYYTPKGRSIQAKGITPDIVVPQFDLATATKRSSASLREQNLPNHLAPDSPSAPPDSRRQEESTPSPKPLAPLSPHIPQGDLSHDYQAVRALELLKGLSKTKEVALTQRGSSPP